MLGEPLPKGGQNYSRGAAARDADWGSGWLTFRGQAQSGRIGVLPRRGPRHYGLRGRSGVRCDHAERHPQGTGRRSCAHSTAQVSRLGAPQQAVERGPRAQRPDELVAASAGPAVGARDLALESGDEVAAPLAVAFGGLGIVADDQALATGVEEPTAPAPRAADPARPTRSAPPSAGRAWAR